MKILITLYVLVFLFVNCADAGDRHSLFSDILQQYVSKGKVNYKELKDDSRLDTYIISLSKINPDTITSQKDKLAFWINVYNVYTLQVICKNYPLESINDLHGGGLILGMVFGTTIWDDEFVSINGEETTLNHIEHEIIRPVFKDPRAHFALVCASKSCPPLRPEAYEGYKLDKQLDDQGKIFMSDNFKNSFDIKNKTANLSKIFSWFSEDFGDEDENILSFVSDYIEKDIAENIKNNPESWDIDYLDYDWGLNE